MASQWTGDGPEYQLNWAGIDWSLHLDEPRPGLRAGELGPLLALDGLAATGRRGDQVFGKESLISHECRLNQVEATYQPPDWGELTVKAIWSPIGDDTVNLELELSARSVGELRAVEAFVLSALGPLPPTGSLRSVEPRDRRAAGFSYDGREFDLSALSSGPPGPIDHPWLAPRSGREGWTYVEMVHPHDAARRIHEGRLPFTATRYGLLGHDLERGIVLRARLRGLWLPKDVAYTEAERRYRAFLDEPPPLTT